MDNHDLFLYISTILMHNPSIYWSWGPSEFKEIEDGASFNVNGFKYQGEVRILYNGGSDTFSVVIGERQIDDIYLDELVNTIDHEVEYTGEDYLERVDNFLKQTAL